MYLCTKAPTKSSVHKTDGQPHRGTMTQTQVLLTHVVIFKIEFSFKEATTMYFQIDF